MIVSFRHKGLQELYRAGRTRYVQQDHTRKLKHILSMLDVARSPRELDLPGFKLHQLKGNRAGDWSIMVHANWRVTFRFTDSGDVDLLDYEDYH